MPHWTRSKIAELQKYFETGLTYRQIERRMPGFTKSALQGKGKRLNLVRPGEAEASPPRRYAPTPKP